jgi:murein DD-endopeptidase MepM/ murein hydrolase activator NlpD
LLRRLSIAVLGLAGIGLVLTLASLESAAQTGAPQLTVRVIGAGKVSSAPPGVDCQPDCSEPFPRQRTGPQVVTLTAVPGPGQELEAWGESCVGTGTCSVVMDQNRVVTARFRPRPPVAPPAAPGQAYLTVGISAGGRVAGPGIACPADCVQAFALGSTASLSAAPSPGFRFEGWQGACQGSGACAAKIAGATLVKAEFTPIARRRPPLPGNPDADGDGLPNTRDLCFSRLKGPRKGSLGCGPLDPILHGQDILGPAESAVGDARRALSGIPGLKGTPSKLRAALALMSKGAVKASLGQVCPGAKAAGNGAGALEKAAKRGRRLLAGQQAAALQPAGPPGVGDAGEQQIRWAWLNTAKRLLKDAATEAGHAGALFRRACGKLGGRLRVRGRVAGFDDAAGLLSLRSGKSFLVPHASFGNRIAAGSAVTLVTKKAKGAPDVVVAVKPGSAAEQGVKALPCMELRIAPFQDFWGSENSVIQHPGGYKRDGALWLESDTRLAASPKCAKGKGRYSLAIELKAGSKTYSVASDLTGGDTPVPLPVGPSLQPRTLVVHERRQASNCPPPGSSKPQSSDSATAAKSYPCPVVEVSKTTYTIRIRPTGSYADAVYNATEFGLELDVPAPAKVTGLTGLHPSLPSSASFAADGYKPTGNQTTGKIVTVLQNETFALWPKVFYGWQDILFPLETLGVDHYAGLFWPRVVGKRNGRPFRYAATLPDLVTDRLAVCPNQGENCYYQPPWPFQVERGVVQGNGPGFSHNGNQLYAFDFGVPDGGQLVAARGGVVGDVVENLTKNYNPCDPDTPKADGPGNYVRIDHQDGTYGYYVHLKTDTVPLEIGDEIGRGTEVGKADNTGRSCGPHLHFQSQITTGPKYYGQTLRIRFNTWVKGQAGPYALDCYIPQKDDVLISTTG